MCKGESIEVLAENPKSSRLSAANVTLVTKMVHYVAGFYGLVVGMEGIQVLVDVNFFFAFQFTHMKITYQLILGDLKSLACLSSMPRLLSPMIDCENPSVVLQLCHKHGVMHRDLKPENFLFANKKETAALKAIDFGLSVLFKPGERFNEIVGSPYYMAPEVLKRNYGPEVDVWSAGVILYILLCGVPPFWAETEQGVAQAIICSVVDFKRDPWPKVSDNAKDLVKKMLDPDPQLRLTAQQVLDHPWLQNAKKAPNVSLGETVRARLKQFSVMNKLKKRALKVIAEHLSVEEAAGLKEGFQLMDTSNRGKINIDELRVGLQKFGQQIPDSDLLILMEAGDVDKDGHLDYGEFVAISVHLRKMGNEDHLHKAFEFFDQNRSGYIEIEELRDALADEVETNNEEVINAIM
ncbi:hypothetical protein RHGRI_038640 [Rhododendron griersonianum]|uniref:non-specific serine/threonine protein kinase n=2 Tax=Rhododendron griersonianum TaxID=479676 RepID=A0AAV6HLN6_9ERIC|nr:hypothetical protein RHGRI_038640 [Rhododendron griersonianum]